jgi:hypothetical protein
MRFARFAWFGAGAASIFCIASGCSSSSSPPQEASRGSGAADTTPTGSTQQAIQGGADDGANHPFAVGVCAAGSGPASPAQCQGFCSGALILPNVVVTARHCVDATDKTVDCTLNPTYGASENVQWITTNNSMFQKTSGWHHVKQIVTPTDDHICGHDIALLVLDDVIAGTEAKPVIPGVQYPMGDLNRYVRRFTAIGYGSSSPAQNPFTAGIRRIRKTIGVLCIPGDDISPCPPEINVNEFVGGDGTCEGDSGSSAFDDTSVVKNAPVSFGVLSRGGVSADGLTCQQSIYTRLDMWRDLIVQTADSASASWTLYPKPVPDWTVYVPPPPDAGAPEAGPKKPTALGFACSTNSDCASKVCFDTGGGKECTQACDPTVSPTTCQDGYLCKDAVCVQDLGGAPAPAATKGGTTTTTSGCSVGAAPGGGASERLLGLAAAAALVLAARRRRPARPEIRP